MFSRLQIGLSNALSNPFKLHNGNSSEQAAVTRSLGFQLPTSTLRDFFT
jgi:hypothetical protein